MIDVGGTLYGTTEYGGLYSQGSYYTYGCGGTIFSVTTAGTEKVLHSFCHGYDGAQPLAGLINVKGVLYGTTSSGGTHDWGTIFGATPSGTENVSKDFNGKREGGLPTGSLIDVSGKLYGTTRRGAHRYCYGAGCGTVYRLTTAGTEKVLYRFSGRPDGDAPFADLVNIGGKLYGTTAFGGAHGDGSVFTVTTRGAEEVIYSFKGSPDGQLPVGGLAEVGGMLYGTTTFGGTYGNGTVFAFKP